VRLALLLAPVPRCRVRRVKVPAGRLPLSRHRTSLHLALTSSATSRLGTALDGC
jgi:hypothetical protein